MGNTASGRPEPDKSVHPHRGCMKPPQDWKNNGQNFIMVSPQSDISNPSQFRHRNRENQENFNNSKTTLRTQAHRQTQRRSDAVPPQPAMFYFVQDEHKANYHNKSVQNKSRWIAEKQRAVKCKARQAKHVFKGCWEDQKEAFKRCTREKEPGHERLKSLTPQRNETEEEPCHTFPEDPLQLDGPQLILSELKSEHGLHPVKPVLHSSLHVNAERKNYDVSAYMHDEKAYVERITDRSKPEPNTPCAPPTVGNQPTVAVVMPSQTGVPVALQEVTIDIVQRSRTFPEGEGNTSKSMLKEPYDLEPTPQGKTANVKTYTKGDDVQSTNDSIRQDQNRNGYERSKKEANKHDIPKKSKTQGKRRSSYPLDSNNTSTSGINGRTWRGSDQSAKTLPVMLPSHASRTRRMIRCDHKNTRRQGMAARSGIEDEKTQRAIAIRKYEDIETQQRSGSTDEKKKERQAKNQHEAKCNFDTVTDQTVVKEDSQYLRQRSTIRQMLLQTYPISNVCFKESPEPPNDVSKEESLDPIDRYQALLAVNSPVSSIPSPQTPPSDASKGLVSTQALKNASFLFSPSYADGDQSLLKLPAPQKEVTPFIISTANSQNRLTSRSRPDPDQYVPVVSESSSSSTRRVRFSDANDNEVTGGKTETMSNKQTEVSRNESEETQQPEEIQVQSIQRILSDLTDITGLTRESNSSVASLHRMAINPIIEEEAQAHNDSDTSFDQPSVDPPPEEDETSDSSTPPIAEEYPTNWSYAMDKAMENGVTPLRNGKFNANATHSPFLRFNEAKKKFSGEGSATNHEVKRVNRFLNEGSGGLVRSRIVAMEERASQSTDTSQQRRKTSSNGSVRHREAKLASARGSSEESMSSSGQSTKSPCSAESTREWPSGLGGAWAIEELPIKSKTPEERAYQSTDTSQPRRNTSSNESIQDRKAMLTSPQDSSEESTSRPLQSFGLDSTESTPERPNAHKKLPINSMVPKVSEGYEADGSRVSPGASTTDESHGILINQDIIPKYALSYHLRNTSSVARPTGQARRAMSDIGNSTGESELDTTVDDFAALLRDDETEEEGSIDADESSIDATVSTVQQMREVDRLVSAEAGFSDGFSEEDTATISIYSGSVGTVSTIRKPRETSVSAAASSTLSSVMKEAKASLPFRESASVKPNEQLHHTVPGALHLSPMQKTPMQARKWRALAAAVQDKSSHSKSKFGVKSRSRLSERDTNVLM